MRSRTSLPVVGIAVIAVVGVVFALGYLSQTSTVEQGAQMTVGETSEMTESAGETMMDEKVSGYSGEVIAGSTTPYIRYNDADFERAMGEGKAVYVYFYATWCPICAFERPNVLAAFDELDVENAVGFEAHWRDGQDTEADQNLARTYGVSSQHTHLFIDANGNLVEKTLTSQSKEDIKSKISEAAQV